MNRSLSFILFLAVLLIVACNHNVGSNSPSSLLQRIKVGDIQASLKWMPNYANKVNIGFDKPEAQSANDRELVYFNAKFEKPEGNKPSKEKVLYLDFDMEKDFVLLNGNDSIPTSICQKIENGIPGSYEYMLAFEKPVDDSKSYTVFYNDKIFGIGTLAFHYNKEDFK